MNTEQTIRLQCVIAAEGDIDKAESLAEFVMGGTTSTAKTSDAENTDDKMPPHANEDEAKESLIADIKKLGGKATKRSSVESLEAKLQKLVTEQAQKEALEDAEGKGETSDFKIKKVKDVSADNIRKIANELSVSHGWTSEDLAKIVKKGGAPKINDLDEDGLKKVHKKLMKTLKEALED